jgi:hypothetical protein
LHRCFDQPVIRFLQHFERNSLLTNVTLHLLNSDAVLTFLTTVMPLIASFDRIIIEHPHTHNLARIQDQCSKMAMPMLKSARILHIL